MSRAAWMRMRVTQFSVAKWRDEYGCRPRPLAQSLSCRWLISKKGLEAREGAYGNTEWWKNRLQVGNLVSAGKKVYTNNTWTFPTLYWCDVCEPRLRDNGEKTGGRQASIAGQQASFIDGSRRRNSWESELFIMVERTNDVIAMIDKINNRWFQDRIVPPSLINLSRASLRRWQKSPISLYFLGS